MHSRKIVVRKLGEPHLQPKLCPHCGEEVEKADRRDDVATLIVLAMRQPRNGQSVTMEEVMEEVPVLEKFTEIQAPDIGSVDVLLTEEEYKLVLAKVKNSKWGAMVPTLRDFFKIVTDAPKIEMEPKEVSAPADMTETVPCAEAKAE